MSKIQLTAKWAIVGAVAGIGFVGLNQAIGQNRVGPRPQAVDGWRIKGNYDTAGWPKMKFTVTAENEQGDAREFKATATLARQEFKGNMMSRVIKPGDYVSKDIETLPLSAKVGGSSTKSFDVVFKATGDADATKPMSRVTYILSVDVGGKKVFVSGARPAPANH